MQSRLRSFGHAVDAALTNHPLLALGGGVGLIILYLIVVPTLLSIGYGEERIEGIVEAPTSIMTLVLAFGVPITALIAWVVILLVLRHRKVPGAQTGLSFTIFSVTLVAIPVFTIYFTLPVAAETWTTRFSDFQAQEAISDINGSTTELLVESYKREEANWQFAAEQFANEPESLTSAIWNSIDVIVRLTPIDEYADYTLVARAASQSYGYLERDAVALDRVLRIVYPTLSAIGHFQLQIIPIGTGETDKRWLVARSIPVPGTNDSVIAFRWLSTQQSQMMIQLDLLATSMITIQEAPGLLTDFQWVVLLVSTPVALAAILLSLLVTRRFVRPIESLLDATQRIAKGQLGTLIPRHVGVEPEMGMLITAFNRMSVDLRRNRDQLFQAEKLAAWREVAKRLAHEVKNPLTPIKLAAQRVKRQFDQENPKFPTILTDCTNTIVHEVDRLQNLVNEFSEFARFPKLHKQQTNPIQWLEQAISSFRVGNEELDITVVNQIDDRTLSIRLDPEKMTQVIINLIKNGIESTTQPPIIQVKMWQPDHDSVAISVGDNGVGMTEEVQRRLFTPYFTTKTEGTGLGLVVVRKIVEEHSGRIYCESTVGLGTTFTVEVPIDGGVDSQE